MGEIDNIEKVKDKRVHNGGYREGSGRKPSIDMIASKEVKQRIDELWLELAEKHSIPFYIGVMTGTEPSTPDIKNKVADTLANRAFGKPKERHELSGPDGEAIKHNLDPLSAQAEAIRLKYENELRNIQ